MTWGGMRRMLLTSTCLHKQYDGINIHVIYGNCFQNGNSSIEQDVGG